MSAVLKTSVGGYGAVVGGEVFGKGVPAFDSADEKEVLRRGGLHGGTE